MTVATTARRAAATAVKLAAAGVDTVRRPGDGYVVLLYHRVGGGTGSAVDLPLDLFTQQMAEVAARVTTLDAALDAGGGNDVVVSFDDGTADFVEHALPILEAHRIPAVVYVATDFVDRAQPFPWGASPLSWAALSDAVATGLVTVGSHTHTHALLDRVDAGTAAAELDRSIELIGERLGITVEHFAYPKALPASGTVEDEVRRRFRSAAVAGTTRNEFGRTDPYRLHRSPVQVADGMRWFRRKAEGGLGFEDQLRRLANRGRYAGAVT